MLTVEVNLVVRNLVSRLVTIRTLLKLTFVRKFMSGVDKVAFLGVGQDIVMLGCWLLVEAHVLLVVKEREVLEAFLLVVKDVKVVGRNLVHLRNTLVKLANYKLII